jgi:hypothetical protein
MSGLRLRDRRRRSAATLPLLPVQQLGAPATTRGDARFSGSPPATVTVTSLSPMIGS